MPKVLITGGSRRLGKSLAIKFAEEKWDIAFTYLNSSEQAIAVADILKTSGVVYHYAKADVSDYISISEAFTDMVNKFGIPDVIINNAGIFPIKQTLHELSIESWDKVIKTNLYSAFYLAKLYHEYKPKEGRIINIGSIGAHQIWSGRIPYHISKNGINHLTKILARELAPDISVNCVNPGTIQFPDEPDEQHVPLISADKIPMQKYATPNDIFAAVKFFASCPHYITGQVISVDGAYSI